MRKLTLDPDALAVQSFGTASGELVALPTGPQIPDSPLCVPSMGGGSDCTY
jgi:hypothetical protein